MGLDIMYEEREVTFPCLEGGVEWSTATGLAACGVDYNGDNKYTQSYIFSDCLSISTVPVVLIER